MTRLPSQAPSSTLPSASTTCGLTPKNGSVAEPGLSRVAPGSGVIRMPPVSVCHQVSTIGQRPSPTTRWYHSQASGLIGSPTEPSSRSDLARGLLHRLLAGPHQRADRGRRGVEDVDLVLVDHLPEAGDRRIGRHALEHQRRRAVGERAVEDVGVAGHPADIGRAPVDVAVVVVEDVLVRDRGVDEIAAGGVQHALGLAGRARGVEDEERVLRVHLLGAGTRPSPARPPRRSRRRGPAPCRPARRCGGRRSRGRRRRPASIAASTFALSGTLRPPRRPSSAVITKADFAVLDAARRANPARSRRRPPNGWRRAARRRASRRPPPGSSAGRS